MPTVPASETPSRISRAHALRFLRQVRLQGWMLTGVLLIVATFASPWAVRHFSSNADVGRDRHRLFGVVLLTDPGTFAFQGGLCVGKGRYADLRTGATVTIRDTEGGQLAVATLGSGTVTPEGDCQFRYDTVLPDVASYVFVAGDQPPSRPVTIWSIARNPVEPLPSDELTDGWSHTLRFD